MHIYIPTAPLLTNIFLSYPAIYFQEILAM